MIMRDWLRVALHPSVLRRGLLYALVVGSLLVGINHGDAILRGDVDGPRLLRIALSILVPYLGSTFSTLGALPAVRASSGAAAGRCHVLRSGSSWWRGRGSPSDANRSCGVGG